MWVDESGGSDTDASGTNAMTVHVAGQEYQAEANYDANADGVDDTATIDHDVRAQRTRPVDRGLQWTDGLRQRRRPGGRRRMGRRRHADAGGRRAHRLRHGTVDFAELNVTQVIV